MARGRPLDVAAELLEAFERCGKVNDLVLRSVPPRLWRADPPAGRGRNIADVVAHMQSIRRTFAKMGGASPAPSSIDRRTATPAQARKALRESDIALAGLFRSAFASGNARVKGMPRRAVDMLTYLMQHDAHHRGQIFTLAKDLGHEFPVEVLTRSWGWRKL
jgi:uncharacterized damage-inducible protein DinB